MYTHKRNRYPADGLFVADVIIYSIAIVSELEWLYV